MNQMRMTEAQYGCLLAKRVSANAVRGLKLPVQGRAPKKYRNKPTNGYVSRREAKRAYELRLLAAAGKINELVEQPVFLLVPKQRGERSCTYRADFAYRLVGTGELIVEDCKGFRTPVYVVKRKLMLFLYGIDVREI